MKYTLLISLVLLSTIITAQDQIVVETNYPGTSQKWIKEYQDRDDGDELVREIIYHANEQEWMTVSYEDAQEWQWYYEDGTPLWAASIKNDLLQGRYRHWYANGQLAEDLNFVDNVESGPAVFYYPSGVVAMRGVYVDGQMQDFEMFDQLGRPFEGSWQWGMFASEDVRMRGSVVNGKMEGEWFYQQTADAGRASRVRYTQLFEEGQGR